MYVARADSSCILNVYTLHGFSGQSNFFLYKKYIEFNTVANLILNCFVTTIYGLSVLSWLFTEPSVFRFD